MDKALRPDKLTLDLKLSADGRNCVGFHHWKKTMESFLAAISPSTAPLTDEQKFDILANHVNPEIYSSIQHLAKYTEAIKLLEGIFIKARNKNYARHRLASRKQEDGESIDQFHIALKTLARDCDFTDVAAAVHESECIRTSFIAGVKSDDIRQRLLEKTADLDAIILLAQTIESATDNSRTYHQQGIVNALNVQEGHLNAIKDRNHSTGSGDKRCDYCGLSPHRRTQCPARSSSCISCGKKGHWKSVCKSKPGVPRTSSTFNQTAAVFPTQQEPPFLASTYPHAHHMRPDYLHQGGSHQSIPGAYSTNTPNACSTNSPYACPPSTPYACSPSTPYPTPYLAAISAFPSALTDSVVRSKVNDKYEAFSLLDTGSSLSFISSSFVNRFDLPVSPCETIITMASENHSSKTLGVCKVSLALTDHHLGLCDLLVLHDLCCDIIIGHDIMNKHSSVTLNFLGQGDPIEIRPMSCARLSMALAKIQPPSLFPNLTQNIHPIACGSRKYSGPEMKFIKSSVNQMLASGIIRPSNSPWRAQVLVVDLDKPNAKPRMVVDYSRTINKFTQLDAYPLPAIESVVSKIAQHSVYSTYDLKSAYHQVPILESEKPLTAFEADGKLLEFNVIPFGVTNGVAAFQRVIDRIISEKNIPATYAYVDNITVTGSNQVEHDANVAKFLEACEQFGLTLNDSKTVSSVKSLNILGYCVSKGMIRPDPERMKPLLDLPLPADPAALQRAMGFFSYYSRWVDRFSDRVRPLVGNPSFPLSSECEAAFEDIKKLIAASCVVCPNDHEMLVLESDASDFALSACLSQGGKPVAFFSRTLKSHEKNHHAVEKEAAAIVEACRKWNHYLTGRRFMLITDQQAVSFMFDSQNHGKIKNNKILRWRIELSTLDFDIKYRPGPLNVSADCLSRAYSAALPGQKSLKEIHEDLVHPGIVRLYHFVKSRNLPFSMEDVKSTVGQCRVCAELKPRFYRPNNPPLIEATKPFDRLSLDFKGSLPTISANRYLLTIVDEYSRFAFAYPCRDMESSTVIKCLTDLFSIFGTAGFIHSDNGPSLVSHELRHFFLQHGIAFSNSTKYNPRGNGQVERYNGVIWKGCQLALRNRNLPLSHWEQVLPEVLHCQRTLLCTATNATPHEKLFSFTRRSASGQSLPSWLLERGPVLVKQHVRKSKYCPIVNQVELVSVNPSNAKIRYKCGRESTVSLRDLAPLPQNSDNMPPSGPLIEESVSETPVSAAPAGLEPEPTPATPSASTEPLPAPPRRSNRERKEPDRYQAR